MLEIACRNHADCPKHRFCSAPAGADGDSGTAGLKGGGCEPCAKCEDGVAIDGGCPCNSDHNRNDSHQDSTLGAEIADSGKVRLVLRGKRETKLIKFRGNGSS
jgi:hypothetical protein